MPIAKEKRALYPENWKQIRADILKRAGDRCERCKVKNHVTIARGYDDTYMYENGEVLSDVDGDHRGWVRLYEYPIKSMPYIVLTISHTDHNPQNNDPDNLRALCQKCHLTHDAKWHAANAKETRAAKTGQGKLFT